MSNSLYSSKILLFGEYSIVLNSFGLAIPYPLYKGSLKLKAGNNDKDSQKKNLRIHRKFEKQSQSSSRFGLVKNK